MTRPTSSAPSQRMLRVGEQVRAAITQVLQRGDVRDPILEKTIVSISEVRMSPDLKIATCYVMPLGGKDITPVIKALAENARRLRGEVARRVELKSVPELRFRKDTSFDEGAHIDALLRSPQVLRDLESDSSPEDTSPEDTSPDAIRTDKETDAE